MSFINGMNDEEEFGKYNPIKLPACVEYGFRSKKEDDAAPKRRFLR